MGQRKTAQITDWQTVPQVNDWVSSDSPAAKALAPSPAAASGSAPIADLMIGVNPVELAERVKGAVKAAGRLGMNAAQLTQYLSATLRGHPGQPVTPTPAVLQDANPAQDIGGKIAGLTTGAALATLPRVATAAGAAASSPAARKAAKEIITRLLQGAGGGAAIKVLGKYFD